MRLKVLIAVKVSMLIFWVLTLCGLIRQYQHFEGKYFLCLTMPGGLQLKEDEKHCHEILVSTYKSMKSYNPEHQHQQI
jgi:hypothetical protein